MAKIIRIVNPSDIHGATESGKGTKSLSLTPHPFHHWPALNERSVMAGPPSTIAERPRSYCFSISQPNAWI